ncbi:pathogenesis-related protein 1-like [Asparagus officinalis]|uniref:pathogenesis-related protein 1-like n=1 Tax=Asparagus officinalis TaxID=4686 RepID=UPI00098E7EB1|nr:pathogenesis-related protein 1-like [Asparagus officinalis]
MSSSAVSHEIESSVSAARLFKASMIEWHNLAPKILPEIVSSASVVAVDGGVGSIRQINFTSVLNYLMLVDEANFECKSSLIEGGDLGTKLESASSHFKLVPSSNGGCVVKLEGTFKVLPGVETTDEVAKGKEMMTNAIKAAEAYLVANPTAYA